MQNVPKASKITNIEEKSSLQILTLEQLQQVAGGTQGCGQNHDHSDNRENNENRANRAGPNEPGSGDRDIGCAPLHP